VGGVAACVDIGLFVLGTSVFDLPYLRVNIVSFMVATLVNYFLSVRIVFVSRSRFRKRWEILLVFVVSTIGLGLNQLILAAGVEMAGLPKLAAKLVATGVVFSWNYLARRFIVFGATHD
jgi:putative flippase GtrA